MVYPVKAWMVFDAYTHRTSELLFVVLAILKRTPALSPSRTIISDTCIVLKNKRLHTPHPPQKPLPS
ncbi:hypothetical protein FACS1894200_02410 [Spirochaetia bacterium]|nr:hypothetical protein FACS1894200_02410 [Spirochaetia bacterium]